ncbi:MAG: hypothetical protein ACRD2L_24390 [Terriglobia bacterium]
MDSFRYSPGARHPLDPPKRIRMKAPSPAFFALIQAASASPDGGIRVPMVSIRLARIARREAYEMRRFVVEQGASNIAAQLLSMKFTAFIEDNQAYFYAGTYSLVLDQAVQAMQLAGKLPPTPTTLNQPEPAPADLTPPIDELGRQGKSLEDAVLGILKQK